MNVLVLFSYGSLTSIDDVARFYDGIYHGHAKPEHINAGRSRYEAHGMPDPLGANTKRIGRALINQLIEKTGDTWRMFVASQNSEPSIETVAQQCAQLDPKRIVTFGLTPFHSVTGHEAYEKKFTKILRQENDSTDILHATPFCDNAHFVDVLTDRAKTAQTWLPETVRQEAEIIYTVHSRPGLPKVHEKMISQYEHLAQKIATALGVETYHLAYRSGQPAPQRWLEPDVLDVVSELGARDVPAVIFIEALSVIENMEVIQEVTIDAIGKARQLGMKAVQSEYLNDSIDFIDALAGHLLEEIAD